MTSSSPCPLFLRELARSPGHPRSSCPALQQTQECGVDSGPWTLPRRPPTPKHGLPGGQSPSRPPCSLQSAGQGQLEKRAGAHTGGQIGTWERKKATDLGGSHARLGQRSQALRTQKATQEPFTSDSRQDMNFKTTCLRYSKLISRASVRSVLFVTEGAMFGISGPGLSRTSKSSLSGLIF